MRRATSSCKTCRQDWQCWRSDVAESEHERPSIPAWTGLFTRTSKKLTEAPEKRGTTKTCVLVWLWSFYCFSSSCLVSFALSFFVLHGQAGSQGLPLGLFDVFYRKHHPINCRLLTVSVSHGRNHHYTMHAVHTNESNTSCQTARRQREKDRETEQAITVTTVYRLTLRRPWKSGKFPNTAPKTRQMCPKNVPAASAENPKIAHEPPSTKARISMLQYCMLQACHYTQVAQ